MKVGMKQQNLFGQPAVEDKGAGAKSRKKAAGKEKIKVEPRKKSKSPLPDATSGDAAKIKGSDVSVADSRDAQMEDDSQATSNFDSQVQEVETQLEETQIYGSSPPVESEVDTQPATVTQPEEEETQPETQMDEDGGEPVSPLVKRLVRTLTAWNGFRLGR